MLKANYWKICKEAFFVTWKNRFLWWFGLLITLGSVGDMNYSLNKSAPPSLEESITITKDHPYLFAIAVLLVLLFIILRILGRGALIKSTDRVSRNQPANYKLGIREGKRYFWKLLGLGFLLTTYLLIALVVLGTPLAFLFSNGNYIFGGILSFFALIIFIPLMVVLFFLREFGSLYIILGKLDVFSSLENSYSLLRKNLSSSLIMAIILILIGTSLMLAFLIMLLPVAIILSIPGIILYFLLPKSAVTILFAIGAVILVLGIIFIRSVWEVFVGSSWILFFREIASPKEEELVKETTREINEKEKIVPVPDPDPIKTIRTTK